MRFVYKILILLFPLPCFITARINKICDHGKLIDTEKDVAVSRNRWSCAVAECALAEIINSKCPTKYQTSFKDDSYCETVMDYATNETPDPSLYCFKKLATDTDLYYRYVQNEYQIRSKNSSCIDVSKKFVRQIFNLEAINSGNKTYPELGDFKMEFNKCFDQKLREIGWAGFYLAFWYSLLFWCCCRCCCCSGGNGQKRNNPARASSAPPPYASAKTSIEMNSAGIKKTKTIIEMNSAGIKITEV